MRILITGSRAYPKPETVKAMLTHLWELHRNLLPGQTMTVVHGDCPTGADRFALEWCELHPGVIEERHPADWDKHGKAAGPIRNQEMVDLGADLVLAFPLAGDRQLSRGTWNCVDAATRAGLTVGINAA